MYHQLSARMDGLSDVAIVPMARIDDKLQSKSLNKHDQDDSSFTNDMANNQSDNRN